MEGIWRGAADCRSCAVRGLALFADFKDADFDMIHAPIDHLAYRPGSVLYQEGARAPGILSVRSGMLKLVRTSPDGRQRIVRVLRPGDVAGLEALATSHYDNEAVALSDVAVCRIPLDVIHTLGSSTPRLQMRLMQKWQQALKGADDWIAELNFGTARQRVSNLILRMRHPDGDDTVTLFARDDMGAMLDLKLETVSREVSRLVREEVIEPLDKQGRRYRLREPARLLSV
ncbi:MAG: Crp/Fnr family transcriptional regulator [Hylemonella sp.]|nr:Crp/Fnr family transcriptional regulator [Hylemonella sp.]